MSRAGEDWIFTFSIAYHHLQGCVQLLEVVVQYFIVLLLLLKPLYRMHTEAHSTEYIEARGNLVQSIFSGSSA